MIRLLPAFLAALLLMAHGSLHAQTAPTPAAPQINARAWILMEANSGQVLAQHAADERHEPASITKLMTAYAVFNELEKGNLALSDQVRVSEKAWRTPGSRMFIEVDNQVGVEDLLQGMIVQSGNDASVALAEFVAGSEETFAALMNQYAQQLAMTNTFFENSTGLPGEAHLTSARDIALLARALIMEFPEYYRWYSQKFYTYNNIKQRNRNALLWRDESVDGLKTGHTDSAGYCLVSSAKRGQMRLIAVVLGTASPKARSDASQALLNYGFRFFETHEIYAAGQPIETVRVWKSSRNEQAIGVRTPLTVMIPRGRYDDLQAEMDVSSQIIAPVASDEPLGLIKISLDDKLLVEQPVYALEDIPLGSLWDRAVDEVRLWFD